MRMHIVSAFEIMAQKLQKHVCIDAFSSDIKYVNKWKKLIDALYGNNHRH